MAGLVYQTAWARYLGLFLGHTSYAVVAVLVAFMGGLAIGNAWLGSRADRTRKPLALYAWLEVAIGIYALLFPLYYQVCHDVYIWSVRTVGTGSGAALVLKFLFSFLTILFPTMLMGATFPALARFVTQSLAQLREKVAALYCINSAGAVAGCLVADFWWIPSLGIEATVLAAAALNLIVGLAALVTSYMIHEGSGFGAEAVSKPETGEVTTGETERCSPGELRLAVVAIGLSGFVAMLYEVVWTRLLALALGSSTHAFSLMLVTFITGITVGAWIIYKIPRMRSVLDAFGWAELALAVSVFCSMFFYEYLPYWFVQLASLLSRREESYALYALFQAMVCFAVMFIPTVCLGMTLPLVSRIATVDFARAGESVGRVFAVNTLGTVLGAAVSGLVLMPMLGLARTFGLGVGLNMAIAAAVLLRGRLAASPGRIAAIPVGVVLWVWFCGSFNADWNEVFSLGLWRKQGVPDSYAQIRAANRGTKLLFHKDGAGVSVNVFELKALGKQHLFLKVNGKTDASTMDDMKTQILSGHVPMLLRPASTNALIVGLGCGVTCGAVLQHPTIQKIDMVEISPEVIEGARLFKDHNHGAIDDPRVRMVVDDAKSHLLATSSTYDIIISEPSNPWMAGVAGVFSREFYESCKARIATNGVMVQWVQAYESNDQAFETMVATFSSVFPHVAVWQGWIDDLLLVGSLEPIVEDLAAMEQRFKEPRVKADLARVNILGLPVFLSHQLVPPTHGAYIPSETAQVHSDFYPVLEYMAQKAFFVQQKATRFRIHDQSYDPRARHLLARYLKDRPLTVDDYEAFEKYHLANSLFPGPLLRSLYLGWQAKEPDAPEPLALLSRIDDVPSAGELDTLRFLPHLKELIRIARVDPRPLRNLGRAMMGAYRSQRSVFFRPDTKVLEEVLAQLVKLDPAHQRVYRLYLAEVVFERGDNAACLEWGRAGFNPDVAKFGPIEFDLDRSAITGGLYRMVRAMVELGQPKDALALILQAEQQKFIGAEAQQRDLRLDLIRRQLLASLEAAQASPVGAAPRQ